MAVLFTAALPFHAVAGDTGFDPPTPAYEIDLRPADAIGRLGGLGLDLLAFRPGLRAVALGWPGTEALLDQAGLAWHTISTDHGGDLARAARRDLGQVASVYPVPGGVPPEGMGSMGGFWTLDEIHALLDSVSRADPHGIVSGPDTIGWSTEGRPIVAFGVFNRSRPTGSRPEVLYTALTHAREAQSMQTLLHFALDLLTRYGTDPEVTYLVDHRELWFVPVVNPDGYARNERTYRATGSFGFWRKTTRDNNGDGRITHGDGVDINRNFGFRWGHDNYGSSPWPASQVYRGPAPFSEPETQVLRRFAAGHAFRAANHVHSYSDATLYPWGHRAAETPHAAVYTRMADEMARTTGHAYGTSDQILYSVNGDADDWFYGEVDEKPRCYSLTTEVGGMEDGFWPSPDRILRLARANRDANRTVALAAGVFLRAGDVHSSSGAWDVGTRRGILELHHRGAADATGAAVTVTLSVAAPGVELVDGVLEFGPLEPGAGAVPTDDGFTLRITEDAVRGMRVPLALTITDDAGYVGCDTVFIRVGRPRPVFADAGDRGLLHWMPQGMWGMEVVDGNPVFTDSPGERYASDLDASLVLVRPLDLGRGTAAVLSFRSQWDFESGYDAGLVEVSPDSGATWVAVGGAASVPGRAAHPAYAGGVQPEGPVYQASRRVWVPEEIDLSAYAGHRDLRLRFRVVSDSGIAMDGWRLDDIRVSVYGPAASWESAGASPGPVVETSSRE